MSITPARRQVLLRELLEGHPLTPREAEVLEGAARGESSKQTGGRLWLSEGTVKSHRKRATAKLGAYNTTHAVVLAAVQGILDLEQLVEEGKP